jgi:putative hydrolase of the HAD superfamily
VSRPPVRAVFFDAGNTLIRMDYAAVAAALSARGAPRAADEVRRAEWAARPRLDATLGPGASTETRATGERYLRFVLAGLGVTDEATVAAMTEWRRAYNPPVGLWTEREPRAAEALAAARAAGVRAGVISNSNGTIRSILESLGLAAHLDFVLDSSEVGVEKPDPRIFALALERAGVAPEAAAHVGDLYSVDVLGARAAGIAAVLLDPGGLWSTRDCPRAPDVAAAVRMLLDG